MKQVKEKIIRVFVNFGKRHRRLTVPVIGALAAVLALYYAVKGVCGKLAQDKFRRRLACVLMAGLLFMQSGLLDIFSNLGLNVPLMQEGEEVYAASGSVTLKRLSGSGEAFMYYNFNEVKEFVPGTTYAFLDDVYGPEDAVTMLGSGAVLQAQSNTNDSKRDIQRWYGDSAGVQVYVKVITKGKGFDWCPEGGLYKVPESGTPTEYRYFCWMGGAQNAGPLYAYSYDTASLQYENVSAVLNDVEKKGSRNPADYTVTLSHDGKNITLSPSSYTIQIADPKSDRVTIVVEDNDGNRITTEFQCPFIIQYEENADGVTNLPVRQNVWKGDSLTLSSTVPLRSGYTFQNWKDSYTGTVYNKGQSVSLTQDLKLLAQWKDSQPPAVDYSLVQVSTRTTDAQVKKLVENALTITDNEPVSECTTSISVPSNIAGSMGDKEVTVTVTDKAGNRTVKKCPVSVVPRPVEFQNVKFTESTKKLTATLYEPGSDTITETGFVWGVMNNPTITLNNGKGKTSSPVTAPNGTINVTAADLTKGVTYYARAYAIAGGITYYSDEKTFGLGLPKYGTFTIKNNGDNTFTVSRESDATGEQTVYYRTVNGSAAGGTHFNHQAGTLTFGANETSKTITITEKSVTTTYSKGTTAYINADRTYSVEIYRVVGGASLGTAKKATRTMTKNSSYTVNRNMFNDYQKAVLSAEKKHGDSNVENGNLSWESGHKTNQNTTTISLDTYLQRMTYWSNLAETSIWYKFSFLAYEEDDGYQHIHVAVGENPDYALTASGGDFTGGFTSGVGIYRAKFEHYSDGIGRKDTAYGWRYYWPLASDPDGKTRDRDKEAFASGQGGNHLVIPNSATHVTLAFSAGGKDNDNWYSLEEWHEFKVVDKQEPQVLGVAPMAGGVYKKGDSFTVALIFDEIVDKTNSPNLSSVSLATTWGTASYAGGADTNVLYFTGTVSAGATGSLAVQSISNPGYIKDMCETSGTSTASKSGSTTATVDTAAPNLSVTSKGVANGAGTAVIKVNTDQSKTTAMKYVWSDSATMPATGWLEAGASELSAAKTSSGLTLGIRKEPGSGAANGKWYLHVIGTYGTTGETTYKSAMVDFGTKSSPAAGAAQPSLTVSTNNTNWATFRGISISASNGTALKYRKMGDSSWTTLSVTETNITVTQNGYYTFLLTAGDQTVTKSVQVEKLDRTAPKASVGALIKENDKTMETAKAGVYTKVTLPVTYSDSDSGVKQVQYAWTDSTSTPSSWHTLSIGTTPLDSGSKELAYTATETSETTKYLHIKVTDQVGYTYTARSAAYKVIAETKVTDTPPTISITGEPTQWTNDSATLKWQLSDYTGKDYIVTLPDGRTSLASAGNLLATQNGTYTVTVEDNTYGASNSASLTVDKIDVAPPDVTATGLSPGWENSDQTISISAGDSQSGVGKGYYKFVSSEDEIPTEGLTAFSPADTSAGKTANVTASGAQNQYLYYKWYDNAGDDSTGREANKTEGFLGPIQIDTEEVGITYQIDGEPAVSEKTYPDAPDITVALEDSGISGGIKSVTYQVGTASQKTVNHNYEEKILTEDTFTIPKGEIPDGNVDITVRVTDHAGNTSAATYRFLVYNNSDIQVTDIDSPVYDGNAVEEGTDFTAEVNGSGETLNYQYKEQGSEDSTYSSGLPRDAGTYTIRASVAQDDMNHYRSTERIFDITIQQKEIELTWSNTDLIYNGASQKPAAAAMGMLDNDGLAVTVTGEEKDSCQKTGKTYTATAAGLMGIDGTNAANYKLPAENTTSFTIAQKEAELTFSNTEFVYDGMAHIPSAEVINLCEGDVCSVMVTGEETEACNKAGVKSYTAAAASLSDSNYRLPEGGVETAFVIQPKPLTAENITISIDSSDNSYPYSGMEITPKVMVKDGTIVSGQEASVLLQGADYTVGGATSAKNYGTYSLSANGIGNYTDSAELTWDITDPNDPTGTITLAEDGWTKFWNTLTFGLFFKETAEVTITGEDGEGESGLKDIYYYVSEKELTESEVNGLSGETWTKIENGGTFSVNPDQNAVIYARITDNSGRTTYINSDGIVLDATPPVIIGVADGGIYCAESGEEVTFTVSEPNLDKVTLSLDGSETTETEDLTNDNGVYTLPAKGGLILTATDQAGNETRLSLSVYGNHVYGGWITKKQGTCEEEGLQEHTCRICGKTESEKIPAAHVWEEKEDGSTKYTADKQSSCTGEGVESQHCRNCTATQKERTVPAAGHSFGEWEETTSECTGSIKFRICEKCGVVETESTAGDHMWEEEATIDKAATCTEDGSKSIHCSRCSVVKDTEIIPAAGHKTEGMWTHQDKEHYHICSVCGMKVDQAAHRESNWIIEKEVSPTENGTKKKICTVCGRELEWGMIPAGGSAASGNITKKVNVKEKAPIEEVVVEQDVVKLQEAVLQEDERRAVREEGTDIEIVIEANDISSEQKPDRVQVNEIIQKAVEEIKRAVSLSEEEMVGKPGLLYVDLCMYKKITVIWQETDPENGDITFSSEEKVEDVHEVKEAVTITLDIPENIRDPKSEAYVRKFVVVRMHEGDSGTEIEALPTLVKDGKLTFDTDRFSLYAIICQDIPACAEGNHTWQEAETVDQAATCTKDGRKSVHCKYCDQVKDVQTIPAAGHKYGDWTVVKKATARAAGQREKVCMVCGDVVKEKIPAPGKNNEDKTQKRQDVPAPVNNETNIKKPNGKDSGQAAAMPETGDESRPLLYLLLAVFSGFGTFFLGWKKKKEGKEQ